MSPYSTTKELNHIDIFWLFYCGKSVEQQVVEVY